MLRSMLTAALYALICVAILTAAAWGDTLPCDCNPNGQVDISDAVTIINYIFIGIDPPRLEWWERDTVATLLVFDGRVYRMADHNIALWRQFVVTGSDTSTFEWVRIGEAQTIDGKHLIEIR